MAMIERPRLDPQTRLWVELEVSRRRKEEELHVGRPVLHRYSKLVARVNKRVVVAHPETEVDRPRSEVAA